MVDEWIAVYGWVCPGYAVPPHSSRDLTADHLRPISLGGATVFAGELEESANPLKFADEALYRSKAAGRNQVSWHKFSD